MEINWETLGCTVDFTEDSSIILRFDIYTQNLCIEKEKVCLAHIKIDIHVRSNIKTFSCPTLRWVFHVNTCSLILTYSF